MHNDAVTNCGRVIASVCMCICVCMRRAKGVGDVKLGRTRQTEVMQMCFVVCKHTSVCVNE